MIIYKTKSDKKPDSHFPVMTLTLHKKNLFYGNSVLGEVCGNKKTFWHTRILAHT